jgi:cytochrome oxidase assembly protein ShyY1
MSRSFGFGLFTLLMVALFVGLGIWQLQRRLEKHALIAALTERLATAPVVLPPPSQWPQLKPSTDEFRRVRFSAIYEPVSGARVFTSGSAVRDDISGLGTWAFLPARIASGETVAVNLGFVPDSSADLSSSGDAARQLVTRLPVELSGYIRFPESAGLFTPAENREKRLWFARDVPAMAHALGWGNVAPFYIDLEAPVPPNGVPKPGPLVVHLKDDHLQYAITWFTLAVAVMIAFLVWLKRPSAGRISEA